MQIDAPGMARRMAAAVGLAIVSCAAAASGKWLQTSSGQEGNGVDAGLHVEYVLPSSIKVFRNGHRQAFIKDVYSPAVHDPFTGDDTAFTIAQIEVNCQDMSYAAAVRMYFDKNLIPLSSDMGEYDETKPVWSLKNMEVLDPRGVTYRTAQYICRSAR